MGIPQGRADMCHITLQNKSLYRQIVLILVRNMDKTLYDAHEKYVPILSSFEKIPTQAPGSKQRVYPPLQALLQCPISKERRKELQRNKNKGANKKAKKRKRTEI